MHIMCFVLYKIAKVILRMRYDRMYHKGDGSEFLKDKKLIDLNEFLDVLDEIRDEW